MEIQAPFQVYDAAAGSGKTFTLVKEFLKKVLISNKSSSYKNLLAVTFTNKAVAEMKSRIIESLVKFSSEEITNDPMLSAIEVELNISKEEIKVRSQKILKHILHNYSAFGVETIDSFNHRVIRTFARDLKLDTNFEISLDAPQLLAEAVDRLISKAGTDKSITKLLVDFALQKTDDDKSWDITFDIYNAAKILLNENDVDHVEILKEKTLADFSNLKKNLQAQNRKIEDEVTSIANEVLKTIDENGIAHNDFSSSLLPAYFIKLAEKNLKVEFGKVWQVKLESDPMYPVRLKKSNPSTAARMDELQPQFRDNFDKTVPLLQQTQFNDAILKNLTALSVLNLVNNEYQKLKKEENVVTVSDFNTLVYNQIKDQPAPFIYERLGERYGHYFIDEFQDTSKLQWLNLKPLVDNALSQEYENTMGSLLLVGDTKQSIYRWRGGLPEQFMALCTTENPFPSVKKKVENLDTNRRSREEIVNFNNSFFSFVSKYFGNPVHQELYERGNKQKTNAKEDGYVKFQFIEKDKKEEQNAAYAELVIETIKNCQANGYSAKDICILTRSRIDGINLGVSLMEADIMVISSETLLLQNSSKVQLLVSALSATINFDNPEIKVQLLSLLYDRFSISEEKYLFLKRILNYSETKFTQELLEYNIHLSINELKSLSLYESCEYFIRNFNLEEDADAYIVGFLDVVYDFEKQKGVDKLGFLEYWESKRERASIAVSEGINAVQIMTIHKSKGLEFPIVIFPFADVDIYKDRGTKVWYPLEEPIEKFDEAHISYNQSLADFGETGAMMHSEFRETLELDNINILYVTLTRAVDQLYVFSEMPKAPKDLPGNFNQLFMLFLQSVDKWQNDQFIFEFGTFKKYDSKKPSKEANVVISKFISTSKENHTLKIASREASLWNTDREKALYLGDLTHNTLQHIKKVEDIERILENEKNRGNTSPENLEIVSGSINAIVNHKDLNHLFTSDDIIYVEKDIITAKGKMLRPDRLNVHKDNSVTVVDYKTGNPTEKHENQINEYAAALLEMGFSIASKLIVYTQEEKIVINKV